MSQNIWVLGEALMDCVAQSDGSLRPLMGGSPFNMARAAALRGAKVGFLNPLSVDLFGQRMRAQFEADGVEPLSPPSLLPTSLAVVQINRGQPSYGFYREGIADRDYTAEGVLSLLRPQVPGILHTGSLLLIPPEHNKVIAILKGAREMGWTISVDINLRPKATGDFGQYVQALHQVIEQTDWLKASDEDMKSLGFVDVRIDESASLVSKLRDEVMPGKLSRVALTFGAEGAYLAIDGQHQSLPAPSVTVADTVGAGDTFWGNTLADWALLPSKAAARVASTLQLSMKAAAINCTRSGCQPPTWQEIQAN
jgi:fructokinase